MKSLLNWLWKIFIIQIIRIEDIPHQYHGSNYGGWTICPLEMDNAVRVYSFGIGEDISFDMSIIEQYALDVFAFDPTPRSILWLEKQDLPSQFHWFDFGIAGFNGITKFHPPENHEHISHSIYGWGTGSEKTIDVQVYRLETIMKRLHHQHLDILKMDVEGAEYEVITDILESGIQVGQILVEFHHNFPQIGLEKTIQSTRQLTKAGYRIFGLSQRGYEYSFIHKDLI